MCSVLHSETKLGINKKHSVGVSLLFYLNWKAGLQIRCIFLFLKCIFLLTPSPTFDHFLQSSHRDDSNTWSTTGFGEEITQAVSIEVNGMHVFWSSDLYSFMINILWERLNQTLQCYYQFIWTIKMAWFWNSVLKALMFCLNLPLLKWPTPILAKRNDNLSDPVFLFHYYKLGSVPLNVLILGKSGL